MYDSINNLPASVRNALPQEAQELYRAAFNRTCQKLTAAEDHLPRDVTIQAHRAARRAVEANWSKDEGGEWQPDPIGAQMKRRGNVKVTHQRPEDVPSGSDNRER